jgi:hypothetical protein
MQNQDEYTLAHQNLNLPHDVVPLPSGGIFYTSKKKSVRVGYLTAADENIISNVESRKSIKESIILPLLRNRLYEKDIRPEDLLETDIEAILIFLRNTSFGPEYKISLEDPITNKRFPHTFALDALNIKKSNVKPDEDGTWTIELPISKTKVKLKPLTLRDTMEIDRIIDSYPSERTPPTVTTKLNKHIVSIDGSDDRVKISTFCENMPIADSKYLRKFLNDNETRLELVKETNAPSGEKVSFSISFGVEFFRPFFGV